MSPINTHILGNQLITIHNFVFCVVAYAYLSSPRHNTVLVIFSVYLHSLGILAAVVACPLDVVKTRVQGQKLGEAKQSTWSLLKSIVQNEGPRYLFKGLLPRLIAVPSMMSFFYMLNNKFNDIFGNS